MLRCRICLKEYEPNENPLSITFCPNCITNYPDEMKKITEFLKTNTITITEFFEKLEESIKVSLKGDILPELLKNGKAQIALKFGNHYEKTEGNNNQKWEKGEFKSGAKFKKLQVTGELTTYKEWDESVKEPEKGDIVK